MRTVPVVLEIAERVRELAAPDAWIVDFTNPVGIVTRALLDEGHRAVGLCNVAIGLQRRSRGSSGWRRSGSRRPGRAQPPDVGPARAARRRRRAARPPREHGQELAAARRVATASARGARSDPLVLPAVLLRARRGPRRAASTEPRAAAVARSSGAARDLPRSRAGEKPALLEQRGGAFYSEAATALIASLAPGRATCRSSTSGTEAPSPGLAPDDVVELPARIEAGGPVPLPQPPLAPELLGLVQHVTAYERLTVEAARTRDRVTARKALLAHPLIGQDELAGTLLERFSPSRPSRARR